MSAQVDSLAFFGATPWHKIGEVLTEQERRNRHIAAGRARVDWTVDRVPLTYPGGPVTDAWGMVRQDTGRYLGTVGKHTHPIQNHEAFELLDPLIDAGCTIDVMGALRGGQMVWTLLGMPDDVQIEVTPGDSVRGYIALVNYHDGSGALKANCTPVRVVCANTEALMNSREHTTMVSVRHSKNPTDRLNEAKETLEKMVEVFALTGETFKKMAEREMRPKDIQAFIDSILPSKLDEDGEASPAVEERREKIVELGFHGTGQNYSGDSLPLWALYNGVTEYFDHERAREAKSASMAYKAAESSLFGINAQIKAKAFAQARQLVS